MKTNIIYTDNLKEFLDAPGYYQEVSLRNRKITGDDCLEIGKALKSADRLTQLYLNYNEIGYEGAKILAEALDGNTIVK